MQLRNRYAEVTRLVDALQQVGATPPTRALEALEASHAVTRLPVPAANAIDTAGWTASNVGERFERAVGERSRAKVADQVRREAAQALVNEAHSLLAEADLFEEVRGVFNARAEQVNDLAAEVSPAALEGRASSESEALAAHQLRTQLGEVGPTLKVLQQVSNPIPPPPMGSPLLHQQVHSEAAGTTPALLWWNLDHADFPAVIEAAWLTRKVRADLLDAAAVLAMAERGYRLHARSEQAIAAQVAALAVGSEQWTAVDGVWCKISELSRPAGGDWQPGGDSARPVMAGLRIGRSSPLAV